MPEICNYGSLMLLTPIVHVLLRLQPKEKTVDGLEYAELQFDDDLDLSPLPPLSSSIDEITYVKV